MFRHAAKTCVGTSQPSVFGTWEQLLTDSVGEFTSDVRVDAREGAPRAAAAPRRCPDELVVGPDFRHHRTAGIALTEINYEFS